MSELTRAVLVHSFRSFEASVEFENFSRDRICGDLLNSISRSLSAGCLSLSAADDVTSEMKLSSTDLIFGSSPALTTNYVNTT